MTRTKAFSVKHLLGKPTEVGLREREGESENNKDRGLWSFAYKGLREVEWSLEGVSDKGGFD